MSQSEVASEGFELNSMPYILTSGFASVGSSPVLTLQTSWAHQYTGGKGGIRSLSITRNILTECGLKTPIQSGWVPRWFCMAFRLSGPSSATQGMKVQFLLGGLVQATVFIRLDTVAQLFRGSASSVAVGGVAVTTGVAHWLSIYADLQNAGELTARIDGVVVATFAGDVQQQASPQWDCVQILTTGPNTTLLDIDDLVWSSAAFGEVVEGYEVMDLAAADGATLDWAPSVGAEHFEVVNSNPPDPAEYIESVVAGDIDLVSFPSLPYVPASISFVKVGLFGNRDGTIAGFDPVVYIDGVSDYGNTIVPGASGVDGYGSACFALNPDTGLAWEYDEVNNAQMGVRSA